MIVYYNNYRFIKTINYSKNYLLSLSIILKKKLKKINNFY